MKNNALFIDDIVARQKSGYTLEQLFYTHPEIFEHDFERLISRQWIFAEHESRIAKPGDYISVEIAGESIIVVRNRDEEVHAFYNVCRHRGSRVCLISDGNVRGLHCPYHGWLYDLNGHLIAARNMSTDFDRSMWSLHECPVRIFEGLIFICLNDDLIAPDFSKIEEIAAPFLKPHGLSTSKIISRKRYPTAANWKLVVENFLECYHCPTAHPEFTKVNAYVRALQKNPESGYRVATDIWEQSTKAMGHITGSCELNPVDNPLQPVRCRRLPIRDGWCTLSKTGQAVAPLMGDFKAYDGGETTVNFGPLFHISALNDYVTLFQFIPVDHLQSEVVLTWLVDEQAKEDIDYQLDELTWLWDVTTRQDVSIIDNNQKGINSRRYNSGPYSLREPLTREFKDWYLRVLRNDNSA